jgi:RNA polymerase sigma-70 factor (ECF subfamily)
MSWNAPTWRLPERTPLDHAESRNETALVASLASGDRGAAELLVAHTYEMVYAALHRLCHGDVELASDLTQDTYRKAWQSLGSFDRRARFGTWLYRIAYNTFLNHVRRPKLVEQLDENAPPPADPAPDPAEALAERQRAARLRRAILALPDELRFTLTARYWGELEVEEIARLEQVTGAAIRKRLRTASERLRPMLEESAS